MTSPYLTSEEAAAYLRYDTVAGFLQAAKKKGVPVLVRGRGRLFMKDDLENGWRRSVKANLREAKRRAG